jgi:hypothetical protein
LATGACLRPSWSQDGRWIYYGSALPGNIQVWKIPVAGGQPVQVTRNGGSEAFETPDGKTLYFTRMWGQQPGLLSVPVSGGTETTVIESVRMGYWAVAEKGIWFLDFSARLGQGPVPLKFYSFETHQLTQVGAIAVASGIGDAPSGDVSFSITRDGRRAIWRQTDMNLSDLMVIENFR